MASMTYLQLCQFAHRYLRSGNQIPGSLPTAIPAPANSDQVVYDIIDAVPRAWDWVQNEHPSWNFMRKQLDIPLNPGQRVYSLADIHSVQAVPKDYNGFVPFWAASGSPYFILYDWGLPAAQRVDYIYPFIEYQEWRGWWDRQPRPTGLQPNRMTELPNKSLEFDPTPGNAPSGNVWHFKCDYRKENQILTLAADVPELPEEFHEVIAWVAIRMVCESRMNTGPLYLSAMREITNRMDRIKATQLPQIQVDMTYA